MESVEHLEAVDGAIGGSVSPTELAAPIQRPVSPLRLKAQSPGPGAFSSKLYLHALSEFQASPHFFKCRIGPKSYTLALHSRKAVQWTNLVSQTEDQISWSCSSLEFRGLRREDDTSS